MSCQFKYELVIQRKAHILWSPGHSAYSLSSERWVVKYYWHISWESSTNHHEDGITASVCSHQKTVPRHWMSFIMIWCKNICIIFWVSCWGSRSLSRLELFIHKNLQSDDISLSISDRLAAIVKLNMSFFISSKVQPLYHVLLLTITHYCS